MAEAVAGLVIGAVGLAALFDSCMSAFEYVESGRHYGEEYQKTALQISLLQLRLSRWASPIQFVETIPTEELQFQVVTSDEHNNGNIPTDRVKIRVATANEAEQVRILLGQIFDAFRKAEDVKPKGSVPEDLTMSSRDGPMIVDKLTARVRKVALSRQRLSSLKEKTKWALHGERKFTRLADSLKYLITDLVELFPVTQPAQELLAKAEVSELICPSEIEEPADGEFAVKKALEEATTDIDELLGEAIRKAEVPQDLSTKFSNIKTVNGAAARIGNVVAKDYNGKHTPGSTSFDNILTNHAKADIGNRYGGRDINIFE